MTVAAHIGDRAQTGMGRSVDRSRLQPGQAAVNVPPKNTHAANTSSATNIKAAASFAATTGGPDSGGSAGSYER